MRRAVIDQPGLKIIVLGLLVSIFFGLTLRSQITQTKINDRLKKIVQEFEQKNKSKKIVCKKLTLNRKRIFGDIKLSLSYSKNKLFFHITT